MHEQLQRSKQLEQAPDRFHPQYGSVRVGPVKVVACLPDELVHLIITMARHGSSPKLVETPNIAHFLQLSRFRVMRSAYAHSWICPADGWPVVLAARFFGTSTQRAHIRRASGADLIVELPKHAVRIALVGGGGDAAARAAVQMTRLSSESAVVSVEPLPRTEFEDPARRRACAVRVAQADPDLVFVGLGVPRQEAFALELLQQMKRGVILDVGAAIEFVAGDRTRAPERWQRAGLEWFYRLIHEPKRLGMRYLQAAPYFCWICLQEIFVRMIVREQR